MKLIVANWKCNPTTSKEARKLFESLKRGLKGTVPIKAEVVVCPPFVYLPILLGASASARPKASFGGLAFGSQNCFWEEKGAFTGEVSPAMLKNFGVKYVIVGHSERRKILRETDEMVNAKVLKVLSLGLSPIICLGEDGEERKKGKTFKVLDKEVKAALEKVPKSKIKKVVVAYEPIWAIGTGKSCSVNDCLTAILFIRKVISKLFGQKMAKIIKIIYGGSVNSQNAKDYLKEEEIQGLLVGGASLEPRGFLKIVRSV